MKIPGFKGELTNHILSPLTPVPRCSHSFGEQFSVKKWTREMAGQREILSAYGGVNIDDIRNTALTHRSQIIHTDIGSTKMPGTCRHRTVTAAPINVMGNDFCFMPGI